MNKHIILTVLLAMLTLTGCANAPTSAQTCGASTNSWIYEDDDEIYDKDTTLGELMVSSLVEALFDAAIDSAVGSDLPDCPPEKFSCDNYSGDSKKDCQLKQKALDEAFEKHRKNSD